MVARRAILLARACAGSPPLGRRCRCGWARNTPPQTPPPTAILTVTLVFLCLVAVAAVAVTAALAVAAAVAADFVLGAALLESADVTMAAGTANASTSAVISVADAVAAAFRLLAAAADADRAKPPRLRRILRFSAHADILFFSCSLLHALAGSLQTHPLHGRGLAAELVHASRGWYSGDVG